jgi:hypothetical protein
MGCCAPTVSVENRGVQTPEPGANYRWYRVDTSSLQVCFMVFTGVAYGGLKGAFPVHCWCKTHRDPVLKRGAEMQHNLGCFTLRKLHDMVGARGRKKYAPFVMCARVYIDQPSLILNATLSLTKTDDAYALVCQTLKKTISSYMQFLYCTVALGALCHGFIRGRVALTS